jgi:hypothetical protein
VAGGIPRCIVGISRLVFGSAGFWGFGLEWAALLAAPGLNLTRNAPFGASFVSFLSDRRVVLWGVARASAAFCRIWALALVFCVDLRRSRGLEVPNLIVGVGRSLNLSEFECLTWEYTSLAQLRIVFFSRYMNCLE